MTTPEPETPNDRFHFPELTTEQRRLLATARVWAAAVRDREPPYDHTSEQTADLARLLCHLLDLLGSPLASTALRQLMEGSCRLLLGKLKEAGLSPREID